MLRRWNRSAFERSVSVASPLVLLMVWELAARATLIDTRFFPAPSSIVQTLWQMLQPSPLFPTGELQTHLGISLLRIAVGFLLGSATGITLGILMGLLPIARPSFSRW